MKRSLLICLMATACIMLSAAGIVVNAVMNPLLNTNVRRCSYNVDIENQIAIVTVNEVFVNNFNSPIAPRYYFPLPDGANATQLRWYWNGIWLEANVSASTGSGSGVNLLPSSFQTYLGVNPLKFDFNTALLPADTLAIELTYVQMLPYSYGNVDLLLRNNSYAVQNNAYLQTQALNVSLHSERTITSLQLLSHPGASISNDGHAATIHYALLNNIADTNYSVRYALSSEELGLWSMSMLTTTPPDTYGHGFFSFVVEPEPSDSIQVIDKVFTLLLDRSGSMYGNKFTQAKAAATYIVNHLNEGDMFNIISFSSTITPLWTEHMPNNVANVNSAINYINSLTATGTTNISGVFSTAVPQFATASDNTANIIIFLTDGQPTTGITTTPELVAHVDNLIQQTETGIFLFTFGIGSDVNPQLLSLLAQHHSGLATFLGDNDLNATLTDFYNSIQNPVLLNPEVTVIPAFSVEEVYPVGVPNLYLGKQLIISGRYTTPQTVSITFAGQAYNQFVSYQYDLALSEDSVATYSFLPKLWAKQKIEKLLIDYYLLDPNSSAALELKQDIIAISVAYGVICVFTQFSGGTGIDEEAENPVPQAELALLGNFPNPFSPQTAIRFNVLKDIKAPAILRIYNIRGELVKVLGLSTHGKGSYELLWDGTDQKGNSLASGMYCYTISCGDTVLSGKMTLLK
jgi:Ca-activated chloride channel homolog